KSDKQDGATRGELMQTIRNGEPTYPEGNLSVYLAELTNDARGSVLRYDAASGRYLFNNPFHRVFALALFDQEDKTLKRRTDKLTEAEIARENFVRALELLQFSVHDRL